MRALRFTNNAVLSTGAGCWYTLHRFSGNRYAIMFNSKPVTMLYRFPNYSAAALCYAQFMKNAETRHQQYAQTDDGNKLLFEYYRVTQVK